MAYIINRTDGTTLGTVSDGTINTTLTNLVLVGKNYFSYGEAQNENFVKLLENFANASAPTAPITGQVWYDKTATSARLKVYDGSRFKEVGSAIVSTAEPTNIWKDGEFWFKPNTGQVYVKSQGTAGSSQARLLGPLSDPGLGTNGHVHEQVSDTTLATHQIVNVYVGNERLAVFSKDPAFTPAPVISGFSTVRPGLNVSSTVDLNVNSTNGLYLGSTFQANLKANLSTVTLANTVNGGKIFLDAKTGAGATTTILTVDGATQRVGVNTINPQSALDVAGVVRTNAGFNSIANNAFVFGTNGEGTVTVSSNNVLVTNAANDKKLVLRTTNSSTITDMLDIDPNGAGAGLPWVNVAGLVKITATGQTIITNATTAPTVGLANSTILYSEDVGGSSELKVLDEAGNETTLSPHNFSLIPGGASEPMAWSFYSERNGTKINVDMLKLARLLEKLTGEKLVHIENA
jgi:hypothetical protein